MHFKTWLDVARLSVTILALALFGNAAQVAQAAGFDFSEDFSKFGRQPNNLLCLPGAACGAVASINSFIYLGSMFPTVYDNRLTPNKTNATDPIDATSFGITGWTVGNNPMRLGFYNLDRPHNADFTDSFLNTKKDWINDYAPGTTVFNSWFAGSADNNRTPTIADLAPEMQRGEDVELFVRGDADYYHVISLTGIFCSDDAMTRCGLRYQDNDGDLTQNLMADLTVAAGGLQFTGALSGADRTVTITAAFSESPIPEPETYALMLAGLGQLGWVGRRRKQKSGKFDLAAIAPTPLRKGVRAMMYIKNIVIGAGLSCVLLSAPIPVHANVVETKTFKNSVPGGNAATDIKITSNRHPFAARSDKFDFGNIDGNDITIRGGSLAQGASTTVTISYAGNDKVVKEKASFSFPTGPDVPITSPVVGEFGGQIPVGSGFTGFLELTNEGNSLLLFTSFRVAVDVPAGFFSDIGSDAALALLTDNNLFISQGTPVPVPTSFALAAGEGRRFNLGPVTGTGYISSFFDVFFDLPLPEITTFGVAVQGVVPEPETYAMLLAGLGLMGFVARRGNGKPLDPSQQHSHRPPAWRGFDLHVGNDRYRRV